VLEEQGQQRRKVGAKLPLFQVTEHYAVKTHGSTHVWGHVFLTSTLVGGECSASGSGHFTPA
jgi:hypothetical protein